MIFSRGSRKKKKKKLTDAGRLVSWGERVGECLPQRDFGSAGLYRIISYRTVSNKREV